MFALRSLSKASVRNTRSFSSSAPKGVFREKTFKENWLSDSGSYPVMVCIAGALCLTTGYVSHCTFNHPDTRIFATDRKALFRGELRDTPLDAVGAEESHEESGAAKAHH